MGESFILCLDRIPWKSNEKTIAKSGEHKTGNGQAVALANIPGEKCCERRDGCGVEGNKQETGDW